MFPAVLCTGLASRAWAGSDNKASRRSLGVSVTSKTPLTEKQALITFGGSPNPACGLAYLSQVDGHTLDFYNASSDGYEIRDRETNSLWNVHGRAIEGDYGDSRLEFASSFISEWYGWSAYHPESELCLAGS